MLFNLIPIDKGMISFYSAAFYYFINDPNNHSQLKDFLGYLKNTLKIIKTETETIEGYAMIYFQHIKEKEDDINKNKIIKRKHNNTFKHKNTIQTIIYQ